MDETRLLRLVEVGRTLVSELDLESVLAGVLDEARELTGARYAALGILDERKVALERFLTAGIDRETHTAIGDLPRGHGVLGELIRDPRPLRLADVGQHPRSYGFPPGHPPMRSFLGVPIQIRGEPFGNLYLTEKEDGDFDATDEEALVVLAAWAGIAIENARLYGRVEGHRDDLERAVRGLEATTAVARAVGDETDLERVLELIVKRGRALVDARSVVILLREGQELAVRASAGEATPSTPGARLAVTDSILGHVIESGRSRRIEDVPNTLRLRLGELGLEASSGLIVPLIFRGRALGALAAFDRLERGPDFDGEDERLLVAFAASAATAVATAKSVADERLVQSIAAAEHERGRWARELHDDTLQALGALRVMLVSARKGGRPEALERAADQAVSQIEAQIESLRALIADLRPAALDEIGLGAALEGLIERSARRADLRIEAEVRLSGTERLSREVDLALYRLVQEALTNVVKHAAARLVSVQVMQREGSIELTVADDGRGFDPAAGSTGFGLAGMRERAALAGGRLSISSSPAGGTTIRAELPTSPAAPSQPAARTAR